MSYKKFELYLLSSGETSEVFMEGNDVTFLGKKLVMEDGLE